MGCCLQAMASHGEEQLESSSPGLYTTAPVNSQSWTGAWLLLAELLLLNNSGDRRVLHAVTDLTVRPQCSHIVFTSPGETHCSWSKSKRHDCGRETCNKEGDRNSREEGDKVGVRSGRRYYIHIWNCQRINFNKQKISVSSDLYDSRFYLAFERNPVCS